jgi:hypothetical protein
MVTWLTRSLLFIIAGAVLAFAVTAEHLTYRSATLDIQTVGVVLLLVGIGDLLLNFSMSMYLRQPRRPPDPYARDRYAPGVARTPVTYPDLAKDEPREIKPHDTEVIRRDNPNWH